MKSMEGFNLPKDQKVEEALHIMREGTPAVELQHPFEDLAQEAFNEAILSQK